MANAQETSLDVSGMNCGSCVKHIEHALAPLEGVTEIRVSLRDQRVHVHHDKLRASVDVLIATLSDAGYRAEVSR